MEIKEINQFIETETKRLEEYYKLKGNEELTLAMTIKVIEEIGELFNEILAHKGYQSKEKLDALDKNEIEKEFSDVIITLLILANRFNVDIEKALKEKIQIKKSLCLDLGLLDVQDATKSNKHLDILKNRKY